MTKASIINDIESLTEAELVAVAPYLAADLAAVADLALLRDEIAKGRASSREEPLVDHTDLMARVRGQLEPRS